MNVPQVFASLLPVSLSSLPSGPSHFPTISASLPSQEPPPNTASAAPCLSPVSPPVFPCLALQPPLQVLSESLCQMLSLISLSPISCCLSHLVSLRVSTSPCAFPPPSSVSLIRLTNATRARVRREGAVETGWGGPAGLWGGASSKAIYNPGRLRPSLLPPPQASSLALNKRWL